jgi:DNA processing protein
MSLTHSIADARAWLTLLRTPGFGAGGLRKLVAEHGSASAAVEAAQRDADDAARAWLRAPDEAVIAGDLAWLDGADHHLITHADEDYPVLLRNGHNPPAALFVTGEPALLWSPQIAIVGARRATPSGLDNARAFARTFASGGNTVTSGLAEGIDGAAHTGALEAGGKTIAVMGTGPDVIYPKRHTELAERIVENGALVTEFPPGTIALPDHFPRRNRIIAALSLGTLVIEANLKSGSLITARLANEQGRDVFALPGSIHSQMSRGCHKLIREGARLVETAEEVLDELHATGALLADALRTRLMTEPAAASLRQPVRDDDPEYERLLAALDAQPAALDELAERTRLSAAALSSMLLVLELDGVVTADSGRYARR